MEQNESHKKYYRELAKKNLDPVFEDALKRASCIYNILEAENGTVYSDKERSKMEKLADALVRASRLAGDVIGLINDDEEHEIDAKLDELFEKMYQ